MVTAGNMIGGMLLFGVFLVILGIAQFAFFIWAIIELILFTKKSKEQTLKIGDVKRVSFALPLGLNILGLVLFFTIVKPVVKNDPVANKKANLFCWVPYATFNALVILIFGVAALNIMNTANQIEALKKEEQAKIEAQDKELFDEDKIEERTQKAKEAGKFVSEEGGFAVKADDCENFSKQESGEGRISYSCAHNENGYIAGYVDTDESIDDVMKASEKELIESALKGIGGDSSSISASEENFKVTEFKGMRAIEGNISNNYYNLRVMVLMGKKDKDGGLRSFFIGTFSKDDESNSEIFSNFKNSFERL